MGIYVRMEITHRYGLPRMNDSKGVNMTRHPQQATSYLFTWFLVLSCILYLHCPTVWCQATVGYQIKEEETAIGTYVGNFVADARLASKYSTEVLSQLRYRFLDQDAEFLTIDEVTGMIYTSARIDRDTLCPDNSECIIELDVAIVKSTGRIDVMTIRIEVVDINDNAPTFAEYQYTLAIPESISDATYNLPLAQDSDSLPFSVKNYQLTPYNAKFQLKVTNSTTGVPNSVQLVLKQALDRETRDFYQFILSSVDGGSPPNTGQAILNIKVGDANDNAPVFSNSTYEVSVSEDLTIDSTIIRLQAKDLDIGINGKVVYSFSSSTKAEYLDIFGLGEESGDIYLKKQLDYEDHDSYRLAIEAKDNGANPKPDYATVIVKVLDVNDNPPQIVVNTLLGNNKVEISELDLAGRFIAHVSIKDPDGGIGGQFECILDDPRFELKALPQGHGRYEINTLVIMDREEKELYNFNIICEDKGEESMTSSQQITVIVKDANDNKPTFPKSQYIIDIKENNLMNEIILQVNASDRDTGWNADITYSLDRRANDLFLVDSVSGIISANCVFDYETIHSVEFSVLATDGGDIKLTSTSTVVVNVIDTNDEPPKFSQDVYNFEVTEHQSIGIEIGRVLATDPDSDPNNRFEYSLIAQGSKAEPFTIDTQSGQLRVNTELDREEKSLYVLSVMANNIGVTPLLSGSAVVKIKIGDINDNTPVIDFPSRLNHSMQISNMVPAGYQVGIVQAHDEDEGDNARLTFTVANTVDTEELFIIDPITGVLTTKHSLRSYSLKLFEVSLTVTDNGFPTKSASATLQVLVNRSILYTDTRADTLLSGTNVDIVISLSVVSAIIMIILIVAIAIVKTKDSKKKKQRNFMYQCSIETQQQNPNSQNVSQLSFDLERGEKNKRNSVGSTGHPTKKEGNSLEENNKTGTRESISSYQGAGQHYSTQYQQQQGSRMSWPTASQQVSNVIM